MKKVAIKGYIAGILTMLLLSGTVLMASPQTRQLVFGVGVSVNGVTVNFDEDMRPFIMDGRTFLSLRAIADIAGFDVDFDGAANTVLLTTDNVTAVTPPQPTPMPIQRDLRIIPTNRPTTASMANISEWTGGFSATEFELAVFERINLFRNQNGLGSLPWSGDMAAGAALRCAYLAANDFSDFGEGTVHEWGSFTSAELRNAIAGRTGGGMNFSGRWIGSNSVEELADGTVEGWINSPTHRDNMLGQFNPDFMGVGSAVSSDGSMIFVYTFMGRN